MGQVTSLTNRTGHMMGRDDLIASLRNARTPMAVFVLSAANLRAINRLHGHDVGDRLLAALRGSIGAGLPDGGIFSRLSGAKFILATPVSPDAPLTDRVLGIADILLERVGKASARMQGAPRSRSELAVGIELRIGGCASDDDTVGNDAEALVDGALAAHDRAQAEQAQVRVCMIGGGADGAGDMGIARQALAAIRGGHATAALQPVVSAENPARVMFREALIRVHGPDGNPIPAAHFMPVLARLGMTEAADIAVLRIAFDHLNADPGMRLSVNLSRASIGKANWQAAFEDLADRSPLAAERLIVEVTEEAALADCTAAASLFMAIRARGVALALDDFGAGQTSFRHLRDFRFDIVKIDGSFISGIDRSPDNQMMVSALSTIARQFDMMIIAEFVETAAEARTLGRLGVDGFQGFLFGRPALVWDRGRDGTDQGLQA